MHVEDPLGFVVRRALTVECGSRRRRRPLKKPLDWPRYMVVRRLSNGDVGNTIGRRDARICAMGSRSRARRSGAAVVMRSSGLAHSICNSMHGGAVGHWQKPRYWIPLWYDRLAFERYRRSPAFARVSARSRPEYLRALKRIKVLPTKTVDQVGDLLASSISARAADKIYAALQDGPRGKRVRQANLSIDIGRRAWKLVRPALSKCRGD